MLDPPYLERTTACRSTETQRGPQRTQGHSLRRITPTRGDDEPNEERRPKQIQKPSKKTLKNHPKSKTIQKQVGSVDENGDPSMEMSIRRWKWVEILPVEFPTGIQRWKFNKKAPPTRDLMYQARHHQN